MKILKRLLRICNILMLCVLPLVYPITKSLYWTVADDQVSLNNSGLCWWFIFPVISVVALVVLLRQKVGAELYCKQIDRLNQNNAIRDVFWFSKFLFWAAAAIYVAYKMLTSTKTWDMNWEYCAMSLAFIIPALMIHLIELLYKWWPLIREEMTSGNNLAVRILLTGKTLLFSGIAARATPVEKIIHTIRTLHWFIIIVKAITVLPSVFFFTAVSLYESFYLKMGVVFASNYLLAVGLRLVELIFIDKD